MLVTRSFVRILALALPLAVAAFPQAMVHYGAAATAGTTAGAVAGKKASDALTKAMNGAAATGDKAAPAEAKKTPAEKPEAPKRASESKSVVKPANMPSSGVTAEAGPSPFAPAIEKSGKEQSRKKETPLVASASHSNVSRITGKPVARTNAATESVLEVGEDVAPSYNLPLSMQLELAAFHPALQPLAERMRRITPGNSRAI